jgi:hypothetical protein
VRRWSDAWPCTAGATPAAITSEATIHDLMPHARRMKGVVDIGGSKRRTSIRGRVRHTRVRVSRTFRE